MAFGKVRPALLAGMKQAPVPSIEEGEGRSRRLPHAWTSSQLDGSMVALPAAQNAAESVRLCDATESCVRVSSRERRRMRRATIACAAAADARVSVHVDAG